MDKNTWIKELTGYLKAQNIDDIDEIISEYDEHFARKAADGYSEEEIAVKLGGPKEIAAQFFAVKEKPEGKKAGRLFLGAGLAFADIFVASFFIVLFLWVVVLGAAALGSALSGVALIVNPLLPESINVIPPMPYAGAVIMGITVIAFSLLLAIVTQYCWALTVQMGRAYKRWHKNTMTDAKYPPLDVHPTLKDKTRRRLRTMALIALVIFGAGLIVGYVVLAASAGSLGFWHAWNWFVV